MNDQIVVNIDGTEVVFEVEPQYGSQETSASDTIQKVEDVFDRACDTVRVISSGMIKSIKNMGQEMMPDSFEVEFGIKFRVDGSIIVASASSETTLKIKMVYNDTKGSNEA